MELSNTEIANNIINLLNKAKENEAFDNIIDKKVNYDEIKSLILNNTKPLLSKVELLDQYEGKNIPSNKISLCFKLTFQSQTKTLKTKD